MRAGRVRALLRWLFWFLSAGWYPAALNTAIYRDVCAWFAPDKATAVQVDGVVYLWVPFHDDWVLRGMP